MLTKRQKERFDRNGYTYPKKRKTPIRDFFNNLFNHELLKPSLFLGTFLFLRLFLMDILVAILSTVK